MCALPKKFNLVHQTVSPVRGRGLGTRIAKAWETFVTYNDINYHQVDRRYTNGEGAQLLHFGVDQSLLSITTNCIDLGFRL